MREIKFRAWVEPDGKIHAVRLIDFGPNGLPMTMRVCDPYQMDEEGNVDFDFSEYRKGFILEQYTGLKDKNGREIYEGDIIQGDGIAQVVFYDSSWCLKSALWTFPFLDCAITDCIIIGNIHENQQLLQTISISP